MIALLLLLAAAPADPILAEARARFEAGTDDEALAVLRHGLPGLSDDAERARVHAFIGLVHARHGDDGAARASFAKALALDACVRFPDAPSTPAIEAMFAEQQRATTASGGDPVAWPIPAGLAFAAAGTMSLAASALVGGLAFATSGQAASAAVQLDALALDKAAREQAVLANALAAFGAVLVVGGAATVGAGLALE